MTPQEVLREVIEKFEKYKIDYMITGSFASNLHGIPRTTFDVDIVISADFEKIKKFIKEIEKNFYADLNMAKEAIDQKGIFNIVHYETGFKIDFIVKKVGSYYEKEFERRRPYKLEDKVCFFASPEDTILSKLIWAKKAESERQFQDALGVARIQKKSLNYEYLKKWGDVLGVGDLLERLIKEIKEE
jgi:small-conductance mechanosensitive channel